MLESYSTYNAAVNYYDSMTKPNWMSDEEWATQVAEAANQVQITWGNYISLINIYNNLIEEYNARIITSTASTDPRSLGYVLNLISVKATEVSSTASEFNSSVVGDTINSGAPVLQWTLKDYWSDETLSSYYDWRLNTTVPEGRFSRVLIIYYDEGKIIE